MASADWSFAARGKLHVAAFASMEPGGVYITNGSEIQGDGYAEISLDVPICEVAHSLVVVLVHLGLEEVKFNCGQDIPRPWQWNGITPRSGAI